MADFLEGHIGAAFCGGALRYEYLEYWHDQTRRSRPLKELSDADLEELSKETDDQNEFKERVRWQRKSFDPWDESTEEDFLEIHQRLTEGDLLASFEGILACRDAKVEPPDWIVDGIFSFLRLALFDGSLGKKGRGNSPLGQLKKGDNDHKRRSMVNSIRRMQHYVSEYEGFPVIVTLMTPPEVEKLLKEGTITGVGNTVDDALDVAELALRGTPAQASRETIRKAYHGKESPSLTYSHQFKELLGLAEPFEIAGEFEMISIEEAADQSYRDYPPPAAK